MRDESNLIRRAVQGDTAAFAELVTQYRGFVFSLCFQRTGRWDDSEDLAQEVFLAVYRSLDSIREPRNHQRKFAWMTVHKYNSDKPFRLPFKDFTTLKHSEER